MTLFLYFRQNIKQRLKWTLTALSFSHVTSIVPSVIIFTNLMNLKQNTSAESVFSLAIFQHFLQTQLHISSLHIVHQRRTMNSKLHFALLYHKTSYRFYSVYAFKVFCEIQQRNLI